MRSIIYVGSLTQITRACFARRLAVFVCLSFLSPSAFGHDGPHAPATMPVTLVENEYVRVLEVRSGPGEKSPMHAHPDHLIYAFTAARSQARLANGQTARLNYQKGSVTWAGAVEHEVENVGSKEAHLLIVELKRPSGLKAPPGADPLQLDPKGYKVLFENDRARVVEARVKAGRAIGLHAHPAAVAYAMNAFQVEFTTADGRVTVIDQEAGKARWLEPVLHSHKQLGNRPGHVLLFELKK